MAQGYDTAQAFPPLGARTDTRTLFGQTIGLVAVTAGLFTLGAYLARNLSGGWGVVFWIASLGLYVVAILVTWYLIIFGIMHLVGALPAPSCATGDPAAAGVAELVLGCGRSGPGSSRCSPW